MRLLIATRNRHKLAEIREIFAVPGVDFVGAADVPGTPEVEEDGATFEANAIKKAVTLARTTGLWSLADDSGLIVPALGGAPGVLSARYAGAAADSLANNRKLLRAMEGVGDRRAYFCCVLALAGPGGETRTLEGRCHGAIAPNPRGDRGFGYDPLFVPDGHTETFAEMTPEAKNMLSHRGAALAQAREQWAGLLNRLAVRPPHP